MKLQALTMCLGAMLLVACSKSQVINSANKKDETTNYPTATVGVTISSIENNAFFQGAYNAFDAIGKEQPSVTLLLDSAKDDQNLQFSQLEQMLNKEAKALVVNVIDADAGKKIIDQYCSKGVALVFFDRSPNEKSLANCPTAYLVQGDSNQAGITQGLQVLQLWKENPTWDKNKDGVIQYAMLEGIPGHSAAVARTKWSVGTMQNYPNLGLPVEKVFQDTAMYQSDMAKTVVQSWSQHPDFNKIEVILANNDSMALGAVEALKEKNVKLPVFGVDGTDEAVQAMKNGDLAGTVLNDYKNQAATALRLAANVAAGEPELSGIEYNMHHRVIQVPYQDLLGKTAQ